MGGYGSGWNRSKKSTVEDGWILSASKLQRDGFLRSNQRWPGSLTWSNTRTGQKLSSIEFDASCDDDSGTAQLKYTLTRTGEAMDFRVSLSTTPLPWGGLRWWFICPLSVDGRKCCRRVGKLYLPRGARYFGCRHCYDLTYTSCQESHKYDLCLAQLGASRGLSARSGQSFEAKVEVRQL